MTRSPYRVDIVVEGDGQYASQGGSLHAGERSEAIRQVKAVEVGGQGRPLQGGDVTQVT